MSGSVVGLDHLQVSAPPGCEHDARRFYGTLLGLEELPKPPILAARGGVWFRVGDGELHVGVADRFVAATKAHPALRVASVDELGRLAAELRHAGVEVTWADQDELPGASRFYVQDPWGNRLELITRSRVRSTTGGGR